MFHRRSLAVALAVLLLGTLGSGTAGAATPPATFLTPLPGLVTVLQKTEFTATWVENAAAKISARTVVVQTSRPNGTRTCDPRWTPVRSAAVAVTRFAVAGLPPERCYRFVLILATAAGRQTVTSAVIIPAPAGFGATIDFTNPFADVVSYLPTVTINWAERDTVGSRITSRSLVWQTARAVNGACTGVTWTGWTGLAFTGHSIVQTLTRSTCYRYRMTLQDAAGYRSEITSGALLIAAQLPAWTGTLDLYRPAGFASQSNLTLCVAASTQMMLNIVLNRNDSAGQSQLAYIAYAQANDAGSYTAGSDPAGWAAALNRFGGSTYSVAAFGDFAAALKNAALRMRLTNKPVGLLVWAGRHAWVMSGFTATADPAMTSDFQVTAVYVSGPLYPRSLNSAGYDLAPDTILTPTQLSKYFNRYYDTPFPTWKGKYVVIVP